MSLAVDVRHRLERIAIEGIHAWQVQVTVAHGGAADHHELLLQPYMSFSRVRRWRRGGGA